jgi:hypothetical protein
MFHNNTHYTLKQIRYSCMLLIQYMFRVQINELEKRLSRVSDQERGKEEGGGCQEGGKEAEADHQGYGGGWW